MSINLNDYKLICLKYNKLLEEYNLVKISSGNASIKINNLVFIKPSGIPFNDLKVDDISVLNLETGKLLEGKKASTDVESHLLIYKANKKIGSVIHTHSNYATAFAASGKNIPVCLTATADEFGDEIKCSEYAEIGGKEIGKEVIKLSGHSGVVLLKNHGVFTLGKNIEEAFKKAVMLEDIAKTTFLSLQLGGTIFLNDTQIKNNNYRYKNNYGQ